MTINKTKIVLQYKNSSSVYWDEENYMPFVALDSSSGGYPYEVDIDSAHDFKTVESAEKYIGSGVGKFDVRVVKIKYEF